ncbi:acetyl-CoA C-acetyltransferase [Vagococcus silagei]|uniref:acetyl-CoA C-acetyltransferase n=1 Tax=Vagococcus silagei TaxID=2508885 RepID=A0A4S3B871_9ENTE|nr:acetyl-CoA C-acetyltransferase [Vagococcus silagei]THB61976.1 acetyl-CoA C-acetyltransferase [Vagococcus silagei]
MQDVVIVSAKRSAIGKFGGSLSQTSAIDLAAQLIENQISTLRLEPEEVDEVILGNVLGAGLGQNLARQVAVKANLPIETSAYVVNKVCGSGLKAIILGTQAIMTGEHEVVVAGGVENMSQAPHVTYGVRKGKAMGNLNMQDLMLQDGLTDAFSGEHMGITAENIAEKFGIDRKEQDTFALNSQIKAKHAIEIDRFKDEIVPIKVNEKLVSTGYFDVDEYPRANSSLEQLAKLKPAFKKDGTVTAGNASGMNDGAATVILMSREKAELLKMPILATIKSWASAGVSPELMGMGPIEATKKALKKAALTVSDLDLIESNEAFAAQALCVSKELGLNPELVNVNGGAIALGHPIGASGARILVSLIHELMQRNETTGLATLCIGGGQGISMVIETER